jgi:hypothetical protein
MGFQGNFSISGAASNTESASGTISDSAADSIAGAATEKSMSEAKE